MALFDQFSQAQAGNGQNAPAPQPTMGVPGFNPQSWGHQPTNFAGGMQDFLRQRMGGQFGGQPMPPTQPGGIVPPGPPIPQQGGIVPPGNGVGMQVGPGMGAGPMTAGAMPAGAMPSDAAGNTGQPPTYAGGMQQFLGMRR